MEGERRRRTERVAEVGTRRTRWKERGEQERREGDGYVEREISLGAGGLIGIRSQIKTGR